MAEFPAMPLWTDAYLADCGHLSDAEHGRYLMLLMHLWRAPSQRLPNDDAWLARRFRRSVEDVQNEIRPLISEFCDCDGNWITQKRTSREFAYVAEQSRKQSERAKARWDKEKGRCRGNATARNAPTPTPVKKGEAKASPKKASRLPDDWRPSQELGRWAMTEFGWTVEEVRSTADSFCDHWRATAGQNARKLDWDAAFRNWCRRAKPQTPPRGPNGGKSDDRLARKLARFSARPEDGLEAPDRMAGGEDRDDEGALLSLRVVGSSG